MDEDYLTIPEAIEYTGTSDATIKRWIRLVRAQFFIDLEDTNEQLALKTPHLRKENIRRDLHGVQQFAWRLSKAGLKEYFTREGEALHDHREVDQPKPSTEDHLPYEALREEDHNGTQEGVNPRQDPEIIPTGIYNALLGELEQKNKEINAKDDQIRELHIILRTEQQRNLLAAPKDRRSEEGDTETREAEER